MIYVITVFISTVISHSLFFLRVPFFSTLLFPICKRHEPSFFFFLFYSEYVRFSLLPFARSTYKLQLGSQQCSALELTIAKAHSQ